MTIRRVELSIDKQSRMSVGRLGFKEGHAVAEQLPDESGWIVRPATIVTQAELEILARPANMDAMRRGLDDIAEGRVEPRPRR